MKLNVGCGKTILEGWTNLDSYESSGVNIVFNLEECGNKCIPLPPNSVDEFLLSHIIEHIHRPLPMMQELHRIAKPGAICIIKVPYGSSDDAWEDPTHVRACFLQSFGYFSQPFYWKMDYGYRGDWQVDSIMLHIDKSKFAEGTSIEETTKTIMYNRNIVSEMAATLVAVKPIRAASRHLQVPTKVNINYV